jgi:4-diphosphocytidyl-2-C-methyl-D-erythritol kinase
MRFLCPSKINLFLKIIGKEKNYHQLQSLFAFIDIFDVLIVEKSADFKLEISGEFSDLIDKKNNLFTSIFAYFQQHFSLDKNISIKLEKNIIVSAGLGGGSSNAAYFLIALNEIFSLNFSTQKLIEISLKFGSDIAFFLRQNSSAIIEGRGEIIHDFKDFSPIEAILINPKIELSTAKIFSDFSCDIGTNFSEKIRLETLKNKDIFWLMKNIENDLEKIAVKNLPIIAEIIQEMKNQKAEIAKMSGSGASCFAIFKNDLAKENAYQNLMAKFSNFYIKKIKILPSI